MQNENVIIDCIVCGELENDTYIIHEKGKKACIVIDPSDDKKQIETFLQNHDLQVELILLTHGHFDHISGVDWLRRQFNAPVAIHKLDAQQLTDPKENLSNSIMRKAVQTIPAEILIVDGEMIEVGNMKLRVLHTPGHTRGGCCFVMDHVIFTGDTLFKLNIGRTDLLGGDSRALRASVERLFALPGEYTVYPGHGASSVMSVERSQNPYLKLL